MSGRTDGTPDVSASWLRRAVTRSRGVHANLEVIAALSAAFIALAVGILRAFGITSGWLIGVLVILGASYSVVGQVLKHRPRPYALALAGAAVAGVVIAGVLFEGTDSVLPTAQRSSARVLAPNNGAPCSVLQAAVSTLLGDSPAALEGGDIFFAKIVPNGDYGRVVRVRRGDVIQLSLSLHNVSYADAEDVRASIPIPTTSTSCWKVSAQLTWRTPAGYHPAESSPLFIIGRSADQLRLQPIAGTTALYNAAKREVAKLADGTSSGKVPLPYAIEPGRDGTLFMNFRVRVL